MTKKLYELTHEFDLEAVIKATLIEMLQIDVSLIFCIDSKSLYNCFVKLSITREKQLMIDVINFRQSYKRREIIKIKRINKNNNSVDFMTKAKCFNALKTIIDINSIELTVME